MKAAGEKSVASRILITAAAAVSIASAEFHSAIVMIMAEPSAPPLDDAVEVKARLGVKNRVGFGNACHKLVPHRQRNLETVDAKKEVVHVHFPILTMYCHY